METESTYANERLQALGGVVNYCPFGCGVEELDEHGYCQHLLGFTNDGKVVETIQPVLGRDGLPNGDKFVSGNKKNLQTIKKGDVLINPEHLSKDKGYTSVVKEWVSSRVYRQLESTESVQDSPEEESTPKNKRQKA